eukprot:1181144-Prorocentrum_minimum.AAC.5
MRKLLGTHQRLAKTVPSVNPRQAGHAHGGGKYLRVENTFTLTLINARHHLSREALHLPASCV